ncbi:hypothetical protein DMA12_17295 [Amycolatopsis balhimycina DSM 5908]|uniref:DUF2530 domain-containing protein n=1 Tax=Amycolatopsis balhimycina DSM 5908 TaxID=1081091 RepID=A0A428WLP9_AMYBA|nr:hypothetical protein [Amycolatopsis balhimycina]RSM43975.1 hypothetical protein DMA12_17295 [Amycolatopsis balhimycina DSM 5908]
MDGSKTWLLGGERIPQVIVLTLAVGATFGAFGWLLTAFEGDAGWAKWLRVAAAGAGALLTVYLWALFAHRLRRRP